MAKQDAIELEGKVLEPPAKHLFNVEVREQQDHPLPSQVRLNELHSNSHDKVVLEISPYDLTGVALLTVTSRSSVNLVPCMRLSCLLHVAGHMCASRYFASGWADAIVHQQNRKEDTLGTSFGKEDVRQVLSPSPR